MIETWTATPDELNTDLAYLHKAGADGVQPLPTDARIVYHDATQDAVKVITPTPNFMGMLMAGGYIRCVRCIGTDTPVLEGVREGRMRALTHDEAVQFVAWKDLPQGVNNFEIITTDDLPRIDGCIDKARKFRSAWKLEEN